MTEKNFVRRKMLLTPNFGTKKNLIKMASNGEVLKVRKFCIVKRKNFDIWAIVIRSHLYARSCVRSTHILYSEYYLADYAPKTASYGKMIYMDCLRLVKTINFGIRVVPIRVCMKKLEPSEYITITSQKWRAPPDTLSDW